ncbi:HEPN domain-containing protein [Vibrio sp. 10N.261.55.B8]|uniref:HEPN domain-containing protein n=1 Tax=Vibrio sp. 10N.261.55.B8 TaxID=3229688 RepID=UPI00355462DC
MIDPTMTKEQNQVAALLDITRRSFRDVADQDYLAARLCFHNYLFQQYVWSAQQAVEKYLKAILLFNGISTKKLSHDLGKTFAHLQQNCQFLEIELSEDSRELLDHLSVFGVNRYLEKPFFVHKGNSLSVLDGLVWELRKYCFRLPRDLSKQKEELQKVKENQPMINNHIPLVRGWLEEYAINKTNTVHHENLTKGNFYFGTSDHEKSEVMTFINPTQVIAPELFEYLNEFIHFPKIIKDSIKALNND